MRFTDIWGFLKASREPFVTVRTGLCRVFSTMLSMNGLRMVSLFVMLVSVTACFKRPDFLIGVDEARVPLVDAGRGEVAQRAAELEQQIASGQLKGGGLKDASEELDALRKRLQDGDLRVGDQLIVTVTREQVQTDTATVRDGNVISYSALPDVSVAGLLRSEVQAKLQQHTDRYLVGFAVRVNFVTRLQLMGGVSRPGFHSISPDRPVSELIMLAGGPTPTSKLDDVSIRRNGRLIVKPSMWRDAVNSGTTVAQLGLQPGDVIDVGERKERNLFRIVQVFAFGSTAVFGIIRLLQFIYAEPE